ncbi:Gfo/Idh/MocA family oxidoreductase [candidate division KSB1 bacterium]|nr:Gfo/Idh/MocA family oxidoreductase [candidate division KSB1 bacterium]
MARKTNVGLIGAAFMGRAHSNGYLDVGYYFDVPQPVLHTVCDVNQSAAEALAKQYGWQHTESSWEKLVVRDDIDLIDICTSNKSHMPIAVAAAQNGKHIICEKPIAMSAAEAKTMYEAAEEAGVRHMTAFNYRRVPSILLAKKMIDEGKIGKIYHFNAVYYQDWLVDPHFPFVWRHDVKEGGSGAHGDMNAHTVDLARFLVGEIAAVCAAQDTFIKERRTPDGHMAKVTVDDALYFMAKFQNGALGNFMATRFAHGRKNFLRLEIFGSEGSLVFNLERLNELDYFSRADAPDTQGFRNIVVTESAHPYLNLWWPPGHIIGWEHTFIHEIGDLLRAIDNGQGVKADFYDGYRCQQVLDAAWESSLNNKWMAIPEK